MARTLGEIAAHLGGELFGDSAREVLAIRTLASAGASDLSFLSSGRYLEEARQSRAGALIVGRHRDDLECDQIVVPNPALALALALELYHPPQPEAAGIHASAVVAADARIDPSAHVGPGVVIGAGAAIEAGAVVHPHVVVGAGCVVGRGTTLHPHVVLYPGVRLAENVTVHAGSVLGADGFGYASDGSRHHKIPQVGGVEIGAEVEIGALSAIDRAVLDDTTVGAGSKIDNLVQVGHNVRIGRGVMISGMTGVAGSARVGDGVVLGGQVGVAGHLLVGDRTQVAGQSLVMDSTKPGSVVAGSPATAIGSWRRQQALLRRLGEIWRRLRALERRAGIEAGPKMEEEEAD